MCGAIKHSEDVPEHTMFVITTDGLENASCRYDAKTVKAMIEHQKERYGWEFLFLGANIDAVCAQMHRFAPTGSVISKSTT